MTMPGVSSMPSKGGGSRLVLIRHQYNFNPGDSDDGRGLSGLSKSFFFFVLICNVIVRVRVCIFGLTGKGGRKELNRVWGFLRNPSMFPILSLI